MSFISEFSTHVRHVSGKDNVVADALSRTNIAAVFLPTIDYRQMAADQATSDKIAAYKTFITGLRFDNVQFNDCTILCDVSMGKPIRMDKDSFRFHSRTCSCRLPPDTMCHLLTFRMVRFKT